MKKDLQKRLEEIYKLYPRHLGKSRGMKTARVQCGTSSLMDELEKAVIAYRAYVEREKTDPQFIVYFSTFMSGWRDWLDPEHGKITVNPHTGSDLSGIFE